MYVILTKNSNNTWDAIHDITVNEGTISKTTLESAIETGLPIVGMDATSYKSTATKDSVWNGESFSGGKIQETAPDDDDEFWTLNKRYVFLCDNSVVFSLIVSIGSEKSDMYAAAFAGETILVKSETGPRVKVGKTFNWDGTELTLARAE